MAEHTLETRILLRYATYTRWMNSNVILKQGEAAIATFPRDQVIEGLSNSEPENTPPAIGIKIGDGLHYFRELPWLQAIAADVYNWAKMPSKPTYTAQEIQGLQAFIENVGGGGGAGGDIVPRMYRIIEGEEDNENKYFLQYTEDGDTWITDTSSYIDLNNLVNVVAWIGQRLLTEYPNLTTYNAELIRYFLATLNFTDTARTNLFVTGVSEENGIISVSRAQPNFSNLSGSATVQLGGTGRTSFPEGEVLLGNDNAALRTVPIADEIAANNHLVPNYLIKAYVDNAVAGLEGAMHYIGDATVAPNGSNNPQVPDYNFNRAQPGDVVLWEAKEYVWTGSSWRLLGDEGSYAVKGSIRDADIDADANIQLSKIYNLIETLDGKVDKELGKGLSSNDYTDEEKLKLSNIDDGALVNAIEHIYLNDVELLPHNVSGIDKVVELNVKEFDDESRRKLGTILEGAQVNSIESISVNGRAQSINSTNKNVDLSVKEFTDEYKAKVDTLEPLTIKEIALNNKIVPPDVNKKVNLEIITLTQSQVDKLDGIESGAQVNVINSIVYDNDTLVPQDGVITIEPDPHTEHENIIEHIYLNGSEVPPDGEKTVSLNVTGTLSLQLIDKLDHIEEYAQVNKIEAITVDGVLVRPNLDKIVNIATTHPEYENVIESIALNGHEIAPNNEKLVNIIVDQNFLKGAQIPVANDDPEDIEIVSLKLLLARIAANGNVSELLQTMGTYIIFNCGSSTEVID